MSADLTTFPDEVMVVVLEADGSFTVDQKRNGRSAAGLQNVQRPTASESTGTR